MSEIKGLQFRYKDTEMEHPRIKNNVLTYGLFAFLFACLERKTERE